MRGVAKDVSDSIWDGFFGLVLDRPRGSYPETGFGEIDATSPRSRLLARLTICGVLGVARLVTMLSMWFRTSRYDLCPPARGASREREGCGTNEDVVSVTSRVLVAENHHSWLR